MTSIFPSAIPFLEKLFDQISKYSISVDDLELDHICYRVETLERYEEMKSLVPSFGRIGSAATIGGREILTIFLYIPVFFRGRAIHTLELPAPKIDSHYYEGYEHAEFVIQESFDDFRARYPHIDFDTRGVSRLNNPDILLRLGEGMTVKFHYHSLEYVVTHLED